MLFGRGKALKVRLPGRIHLIRPAARATFPSGGRHCTLAYVQEDIFANAFKVLADICIAVAQNQNIKTLQKTVALLIFLPLVICIML